MDTIILSKLMSLLLATSSIFENSNLIDNIHQSYIDLKGDILDDDVVKDLLIESISYLDNCDPNMANELVSLIPLCFLRFPNELLPIFTTLFEKSESNTIRILATASSLSILTHINPQLRLPDYHSFVDEAFDQIFSQIQNPEIKSITVFDQIIPNFFKYDLIIDLLLSSKLTDDLLSKFLPFVCTQNIFTKNPKFSSLARYIIKSDLTQFLSPSILTDCDLFFTFSVEDLSSFFPYLSDQIFIQIFNNFEQIFIKSPELNASFITNLIDRCERLNLRLQKIERVFNFLSSSELTENIIKHLKKYDFIIPNELANKFNEIENIGSIVRVSSNYFLHFKQNENSDEISFNDKINKELTMMFREGKINEILDNLIFNNIYPPNRENVIYFLSFINSLSKDEIDSFYSVDQNKQILFKILDKEVIPPTYLLQLVNCRTVLEVLQSIQDEKHQHQKILLQYSYKFSKVFEPSEKQPLEKIKILPLKYLSNEKLTEFIEKNDFDLLSSFDDEILLFVISALHFADHKVQNIDGLTKENILQFYAILLNNILNINSGSYDILLTSSEMKFKLQEGLQLLSGNETKILTTSINTILSNINSNINLIKSDFSLILINSLIEILIDNNYNADKSIIFKFILNLSIHVSNELRILNGIKIIQCMIEKMDFLVDLKGLKLNLDIFNLDEIANFFVQIIQNQSSSYEEVINIIYLIQNLLINIPILKIKDSKKLSNVANEAIKIENWNHLSLVCQYMFDCGFTKEVHRIIKQQIPSNIKSKFLYLIPIEERTEDDFISIFLEIPNPEINDMIFEDLFKKIMKENSTAFEYLKLLVCKFGSKSTPEDLLNTYLNEYLIYGNNFIKAIDSCFVYNSIAQVFIRKYDTNSISLFKYKNSRFINSLLFKLFNIINDNPEKYQFFLFLKNIACTFPFVFDSKPESVFNSVLQALDSYSLIFENELENKEKEKSRINKIKTAITAISFLLSSLYSTKVLDSFIVWMFGLIEKLSNSQVFCLALIMKSLIKSSTSIPFLSILNTKIDIIINLMNRKLPNGEFSDNYYQIFYEILIEIYATINKMDQKIILLTTELSKMKCPFVYYYNNDITIFPSVIDFSDYSHKILHQFTKDIERDRPFWFKSYLRKNVSQDQVNIFMDHYKKLVKIPQAVSGLRLQNHLNTPITEKMVIHSITKGKWIFDYLFMNELFPLLPQHAKILDKVIKELNKIENNYFDDIEYVLKFQYFKSLFENQDLFKLIVDNMSTVNSTVLNLIYKLCVTVKSSYLYEACNSFINKKYRSLNESENEGSILMTTLIPYLPVLGACIYVISMSNNSYSIINEDIFKIILRPQYRTNKIFLMKYSSFLSPIPKNKLPDGLSFIIEFMLLLDDEDVTRSAIKLCPKFDQKILNNFSIIHDVYIKEVEKEKPSLLVIKDFCHYFPNVVKSRKYETMNLLQKILNEYNDKCITEQNKEILADAIFYVIDALTPSRDNAQSFSMSDSSRIEMKLGNHNFSFQPIPECVFNSSPEFWDFFDKNRLIITEIIENRIENLSNYKLFNEFPELFDYKIRLQYFKEKVKSNHLLSGFENLKIDRENILTDSFEQIKFKEKNNLNPWMKKFFIRFNGEEGSDMGGLTKDWFNKTSKALFDSETGLFIEKEKTRNYMPNSNSSKYEYFEFAGKLIARMIIEGLNIDFHLAQPFIKQILHRKINIKDMANVEPIKFKSFNDILEDENIDNDPINEFYFEVTIEGENGPEIVELKENGSQIKVTNKNKLEYIQLLTNYYLSDSIKKQINAFVSGFESIISHQEIRIFSASEFDMLICGITFIDVDDIRQNTIYTDYYCENTPVVKLFFESISKWEQENLAKLLLFFTGSSIVPIGGFKNEKIKIQPGGDRNKLPVAHTCFNALDLPEYETEDELNQKFMLAINQDAFYLI